MKEKESLYLGLSGLDLGGQIFELGEGIQLRSTFAHVFSSDILAFERPATPTSFHPGPWQAVSHKAGIDILAELYIPKEYAHPRLSNLEIGHTIISLLRLWADPQITLQVLAHGPVSELKERQSKNGGELVALLYSRRERHVNIALIDNENVLDGIDWVVDHWKDAIELRGLSPEFNLAIDTFDNAQCIPSTAMALVSIWGALEAIFSPHKAELVFRVSAQLAAFLEPRGVGRLQKQKEIVKLYNLRSAAAHGSPKHGGDDLVTTLELLRIAIIRMVERKVVPDKSMLEELLFVS
ncbi:hypothetical protein [Pseudomonas sp. 58(2021)]|uniref:hypothetical protein n=1 Tax=Pseudomonas sp. 58(2021) TaxID=2813330 RepID=UPI001A9F7385|nr:hypothetical protein [Pseudomonas sp. 58(2021)]